MRYQFAIKHLVIESKKMMKIHKTRWYPQFDEPASSFDNESSCPSLKHFTSSDHVSWCVSRNRLPHFCTVPDIIGGSYVCSAITSESNSGIQGSTVYGKESIIAQSPRTVACSCRKIDAYVGSVGVGSVISRSRQTKRSLRAIACFREETRRILESVLSA